ncbi:methyl-accepting chemotaxis protein [Litchfieldella xinjiangensis]|uniref:methyl-accepting chemotaxis protein n=1 Tax=Litchfieldella xinjiangensis TaxID=1166948 RepID=UPI0005B93BC3|nr:methyl-accepting chemotaxis protein [Halomonas xinjiangensis]
MNNAFTRFLSGMSIRARLLAGFSTVILLMVILTAMGIRQVNGIDEGLTTINDINSVKQRHAIDFRGSVHDRAIALRDVTLVEDSAALEVVLDDIERLAENYRQAAIGMGEMFGPGSENLAEERSALAEIAAIEQRTLPLLSQVIDLRLAGDVDAARRLLLDQAAPAFSAWLASINVFIDLQERLNEAETAAARDIASGFQIFMLALCTAAAVIGALVALLLTRLLLRELGAEPAEVKAFAEAVGRGELGVKGRLRRGDRYSIMASMGAMAEQLQMTVSRVRDTADSVASNSEQIAAGNGDLASRTEQQASALAETASAMEELGSTVRQNADNAKLASDEAAKATGIARKGGTLMGEVVVTMQDLDNRSKEIAAIITMIDDIAFQTNILALNASVEAARAGEHGRGFAVVASEVRNLAQRSAEAAGEINSLISGNLERVEKGNQLVAQAGHTTEEIVVAIERVTQLVGDISHASAEQSIGVAQVGEAVTQMDQVTQQNSTLVVQSASAAENLRQRARQLLEAMEVFQLGERQRRDVGMGGPSASPLGTLPAAVAPGKAMLASREAEWQSF